MTRQIAGLPTCRSEAPAGQRGFAQADRRGSASAGRRFAVLIAMAALFLSLQGDLAAQDRERKVKAAVVYQLIRFTRWPDSSFAGKRSPIVVATLYSNPFGKHLKVLERKRIRGRPLRIVHHQDPVQAAKAHVVFVGSRREAEIARALKVLSGRRLLTIGEHARFLELGGAVNLLKIRKKVKFEVCTRPLQQGSLHLSAKVLKLAVRVFKERPTRKKKGKGKR